MDGHFCDNCETHLDDSDYTSYGSWSYTCHTCGFTYRHGAATAQEQVDKFNNVKGEKMLSWPTMEEVQKENDRSTLIAIACEAWGNCHLEKPPAYFGDMMVLIGQKIGDVATPTNIAKLADEIIANK